MPVKKAGPRLYRSVPFHHLVHKTASSAGSGGGKASNISLNLTPFVDMMTILVTFLLMVFSSSGELLQAQRGLDMAIADSKLPLQSAPTIIVSRTDITFGTKHLAVDDVLRDETPTMKIDELFDELEASAKKIKEDVNFARGFSKEMLAACDAAKLGFRPKPGEAICPDGLAILQADKDTDTRIINKIVNTAKIAGFDNLLFAVKNK